MNVGPRLTVGDTLNEVFYLYREHFGVLIPVAFWLFLAVSVVVGLAAGSLALLIVGGILALAVNILYQGIVVTLVSRTRAPGAAFPGGERPAVCELIGSVGPVLSTLVIVSLIAGVGEFVGLIFFLVPGCMLMTIWAVVAPAVVIERRGVSAAFTRSQKLVEGFGWPVFGAVLSAALIAAIATIVLGNIGEAIAGGPLLRIVFGVLASTLAAPIQALTAAVLYYRLLALKGASEVDPPAARPIA
jgi:hypothetical protein